MKDLYKDLHEHKKPYCYKCQGDGHRLYNIPYCCEGLKEALHDCRIAFLYFHITRDFSLYIKNSPFTKPLLYCPWCGKKLPDSLRDTFFEILEREHSIQPSPDILDDPNLPEEFKSSVWWMRRGL